MRPGVAPAAVRPHAARIVGWNGPWATVGLLHLALGALLLWRFALFLVDLRARIGLPFQLDYGEGIVWQQALLIAGPAMYGDITHAPFIVFHYPPLYHLVVRAAAWLAPGVPMLVVGRGVSAVASLAIGLLAAAIGFHIARFSTGRMAALAGAAMGGLAAMTLSPLALWAPFMRVDMLALALSFAGVFCALQSWRRPWMMEVAMAAFVLAVFTKQTAVAAPLATVPVLLLARPGRAIRAVGFGLLLALLPLALLTWLTHGGFLRHILLYNINRFSLADVPLALAGQAVRVFLVLLGIAGLRAAWSGGTLRRLRRSPRAFAADPRDGAVLIVTLHLALATVMLVQIGKSGATSNYLIEWMCLWSIATGILMARLVAPGPSVSIVAACVVPAVFLLQVTVLPPPGSSTTADEARRTDQERLAALVGAMPGPVLSDDMVLLLQAGKTVQAEPAILTELASTGAWDQRPLLGMIRGGAFSGAITTGAPGDRLYDSRFTPEMTAAIAAAFPRTIILGSSRVHLP